jgi:hypothetical protein
LGRGSGDTGEHAAPWPGSCWRLVRRFESWAGFVPEGNAHDLLFREVCWSYREDFSFRSPLGALMESGSSTRLRISKDIRGSCLRAIYPISI